MVSSFSDLSHNSHQLWFGSCPSDASAGYVHAAPPQPTKGALNAAATDPQTATSRRAATPPRVARSGPIDIPLRDAPPYGHELRDAPTSAAYMEPKFAGLAMQPAPTFRRLVPPALHEALRLEMAHTDTQACTTLLVNARRHGWPWVLDGVERNRNGLYMHQLQLDRLLYAGELDEEEFWSAAQLTLAWTTSWDTRSDALGYLRWKKMAVLDPQAPPGGQNNLFNDFARSSVGQLVLDAQVHGPRPANLIYCFKWWSTAPDVPPPWPNFAVIRQPHARQRDGSSQRYWLTLLPLSFWRSLNGFAAYTLQPRLQLGAVPQPTGARDEAELYASIRYPHVNLPGCLYNLEAGPVSNGIGDAFGVMLADLEAFLHASQVPPETLALARQMLRVVQRRLEETDSVALRVGHLALAPLFMRACHDWAEVPCLFPWPADTHLVHIMAATFGRTLTAVLGTEKPAQRRAAYAAIFVHMPAHALWTAADPHGTHPASAYLIERLAARRKDLVGAPRPCAVPQELEAAWEKVRATAVNTALRFIFAQQRDHPMPATFHPLTPLNHDRNQLLVWAQATLTRWCSAGAPASEPEPLPQASQLYALGRGTTPILQSRSSPSQTLPETIVLYRAHDDTPHAQIHPLLPASAGPR